MYLKIYEGIFKSFDDLDSKKTVSVKLARSDVEQMISYLELGELEKAEDYKMDLSVYDLERDIMEAVSLTEKSRCVLLLDDAAHAFSPDQQRDFFEFFRKIKSRYVYPNAAKNTGVTSFAPKINNGPEAEEVNVWLNPEDENYLEFMTSMIRNRLPDEVYGQLEKDQSLITSCAMRRLEFRGLF
jgi:hypothetical protein